MSTFGPGDATGNDCAWSGANSFWTNWNTSTFSTGIVGRITALAMRWDGSNNAPCTTCTGRNDLWNTSNSLVLNTTTYSVVCTAICNGGIGQCTLHNVGTSDLWQSSASYYLGIWRPSNQCTSLVWVNNANGGYAGKSADDGTNSGGTANWGGTTNGGLLGYGTVTVSNIYVKRAGSWNRVLVFLKRSGAWNTTPSYVYVKRAGAWTLVNELKEYEIPKNGEEILVDIGEGPEKGWIVEEGEKSWFGSSDPTTQKFDWTKEGHYQWDQTIPWSGKYNSFEPEEVAYKRLEAQYNWDFALRWENYSRANELFPKFQPPIITPQVPIIEEERKVLVPASKVEKSVFEDPEPIIVPCGCN